MGRRLEVRYESENLPASRLRIQVFSRKGTSLYILQLSANIDGIKNTLVPAEGRYKKIKAAVPFQDSGFFIANKKITTKARRH